MGKNAYPEQETSIKKHVSLQNMGFWLYMTKIWKKIIIDHEQLQFDKTDGWTLIGIPEKEYGTLSDHNYFCIHDDLFNSIKQIIRSDL